MKMKCLPMLCGMMLLIAGSAVQADVISRTDAYGVNISDANQYDDGNTLFQLFNKYFADQLGDDGLYSSSNDLFNNLGVDPRTDWTTEGSQLVGAFKVAAFGHEMSVVSKGGEKLGSIIDVAGTSNIHSENGISDLSGGGAITLPDGVHINFQLDATAWGQDAYSWSSDPDANGGDGEIHMIALEITELYNEKYGTDFDSVYMLGWEDLDRDGTGGYGKADWDYQDFVAIITNIKPTSTATPEPATWIMFLTGGVATAAFWRKRANRNSKV